MDEVFSENCEKVFTIIRPDIAILSQSYVIQVRVIDAKLSESNKNIQRNTVCMNFASLGGMI